MYKLLNSICLEAVTYFLPATLLALVLSGCGDSPPRMPNRYAVGDVVYMKVDDRKGVVSYCWNTHGSLYNVKFSVKSEGKGDINIATGAGIGSGGKISSEKLYVDLMIKEEELYSPADKLIKNLDQIDRPIPITN
jgi:hypothetical protein